MSRDHILGWQMPAQPLGPAIRQKRKPTPDEDDKRAELAVFESVDWTPIEEAMEDWRAGTVTPTMEPTIIGVDMAASGQCLSAVGFWRDVPRVDDKADAFALLRRPMSFLDLATGAVAWLPTPEAEKPAQAEPQADADADADADGWIAHDGGPCPQWVKDSRAAGAKVYVRFRSGSESDTKASGSAALDVVFRNISKPGWDNLDVLAYRVVPA